MLLISLHLESLIWAKMLLCVSFLNLSISSDQFILNTQFSGQFQNCWIFLSTWHPALFLSMKHLTLKVVALLALSSSDRGQTLHSTNIEHTEIQNEAIIFIIKTRLKTMCRVLKPKVVRCIMTVSRAKCV